MRNLILIVMTVISPLSCFAQFTKGDKAIGGSFNFSSQKTPPGNLDGYESRSTYFSFHPGVRFFISEKVAVGGGVGFQTSNNSSIVQNYLSSYRSHGYSIDLRIRRYATLAEGFFFSLGASAAYGRGWSENSSTPDASRYNSFGLNASPSLHFFPTKNWSIEGGIGYIGVATSRQPEIDRKSTSFNVGLGYLNFGVAYYLRQ